MKFLSDRGICTVVCTIHQPQVKIFELFDNLVLMRRGLIVYQGSCIKSLLFLASIGMPCPANVNPADFLLDTITAAPSASSDNGADPMGSASDAFEENAKLEVPVDLSQGYGKGFQEFHSVTLFLWTQQVGILIHRNVRQYWRRMDIVAMNLIATVLLAVFVSCGIWKNIGTGQTSIALRAPSLFFASVLQGILAALQSISSFPRERAIMLRERAAGSYNVSAYFVSKTVVDIATQLWIPTVFSIIVYPTIGYQPSAAKFFLYWMFLCLDMMAALSLATMSKLPFMFCVACF